MTLNLITAPAELPVSIAEAKAHLRITVPDEDVLITAMLGAATQAAEHLTGGALMPQTWEAGFDTFPVIIPLTRVPVLSVTSLSYTDATGTVQTLAPELYQLSQDGSGCARIVPAYGTAWPVNRGDVDSIKVRYVAGYADAASVPQAIKSWILLQCGALFENREAEVIERGAAIELGFADRLLDRYRVYSA